MSDWNTTALTPHVAPPTERAISGEEALACCLKEIQRLHGIVERLQGKLDHANATLTALINADI